MRICTWVYDVGRRDECRRALEHNGQPAELADVFIRLDVRRGPLQRSSNGLSAERSGIGDNQTSRIEAGGPGNRSETLGGHS